MEIFIINRVIDKIHNVFDVFRAVHDLNTTYNTRACRIIRIIGGLTIASEMHAAAADV